MQTIYWHDYETFGTRPATDWPSQFAGIRTDLALNEVGESLMLYCAPPMDQLPAAEACLVTGITPQIAQQGLCEAEFIGAIEHEFAQGSTCVAGYNSIRFDDEVTRHSLYRNFFDPYAREWQNGNSRWDIIDLMRATYALRPDGINWPLGDNGEPSFRLELLTQANGISHESAHDALSDVRATIAMARLVKEKQPKLFKFAFEHRQKRSLGELVNIYTKQPFVHISGRYGTKRNNFAIELPFMEQAGNKNGVIIIDLCSDPQILFDASAEELRGWLYAKGSELGEQQRPPLKVLHLNKCPLVAPLKVLRVEDQQRLGVDLAQVEQNRQRILANKDLSAKLIEVFAAREFEAQYDPDHMLYSGGFFSREDKVWMDRVRQCEVAKLAELKPHFEDVRLDEMFFRYRARNYPQTLDVEEQQRWLNLRRLRLLDPNGQGGRTLDEFRQSLLLLLEGQQDEAKREVLAQLEAWGQQLEASLA